MTIHFANRTLFSIALLAVFTIGAACSDDDSMKQAAEKGVESHLGETLDDDVRELTDVARSSRDALEAEASRAAGVVEAEASELADAARHGGAARTVEDARVAAQELREQGGAKAVAKELEQNVENSLEVYDEAYDEAKKRDENALEAGGDAYNAVLDIPRQKGAE